MIQTATLPGPADTLCIDFANTLYWRGTPTPTETLGDAPALRPWCSLGWTEQAPLAACLALREAIYAVLAARAQGHAPAADAAALLAAAVAEAPARLRLVPGADGWGWEVAPRSRSAAVLLTRVLWSAADLLAGPRADRLRLCANPQCRYLFLDDSRAGNRRWCAMSACGNRAKARRHYARRKADRTAPGG